MSKEPVIAASDKHASKNDVAADSSLDHVIFRGLSELGVSPRTFTNVYLKLSLPSQGLRNVDFLSNYPHLMTLQLPGNNLTDASSISGLSYLVSCDLSNNKLTKFELDSPPFNLQYLDLSRNQFMTIGQMSRHPYLQMLCMDQNIIKKIDGLQGCRHLTHLSLVNNGITQIENLDNLPLHFLDLRRNRIRSLGNFDTLIHLEELYLGQNEIGSLQGLPSSCVSLKRLGLEDNYLSSAEEIDLLTSFRWLSCLNLHGNPLAYAGGGTLHRLLILFALPQLTVLDEKTVSPEEKVAAVNHFDPSEEVITATSHSLVIQKLIQEYITANSIKSREFAAQFKPIVVCGPSGAGKRTLTRRLIEEYPHLFAVAVSHTTRERKRLESNGVDYFFVTRSEMETMHANGHLLTLVDIFDNQYGLSYEAISKVQEQGKICLIEVELEATLALKQADIALRFVFVSPPSLQILQTRLESRVKSSLANPTPISIERVYTLSPDSHIDVNPTEIELSNASHQQQQQEADNTCDLLTISRDVSKNELAEEEQQEVKLWLKRAEQVTSEIQDKGMLNDSLFFEETIVNNDIEVAYTTFKKFCLCEYWKWYTKERERQRQVTMLPSSTMIREGMTYMEEDDHNTDMMIDTYNTHHAHFNSQSNESMNVEEKQPSSQVRIKQVGGNSRKVYDVRQSSPKAII